MEKVRMDYPCMKKKKEKEPEDKMKTMLNCEVRKGPGECNVNRVGRECEGGEGTQHPQKLPKVGRCKQEMPKDQHFSSCR